MSNVSAFLKKNVKQNEKTVEYKVSERFEEPFILRRLSGEEILTIQDASSTIEEDGKPKQSSKAFAASFIVACVEHPNLLSDELLTDYEVNTPHELINAMLEGDEYMFLFNKCSNINGLNKTYKELQEEAKN